MKKAIEINATTCQVCGNETDWDVSFGQKDFIVCPHCFTQLMEKQNATAADVLRMIFTMSDIRKEQNENA